MTKIIIGFISLFIIFFFGIDIFRRLTKMEKISIARWVAYSSACTLLTTIAVATIVILF